MARDGCLAASARIDIDVMLLRGSLEVTTCTDEYMEKFETSQVSIPISLVSASGRGLTPSSATMR